MPFNIITSTDEATVVAEYTKQKSRSEAYQSEAALEDAFIKQLVAQGYTYMNINSSKDLVDNLRTQLEKLNSYKFSNDEWTRFFKEKLSSASATNAIVEKTRKIQEDNIQVLTRDDGTSKNIMLINKKNIHANYVQVINQYVENNGNKDNRYDVTILVNGFPLVHVELKRRGVNIKEAFNQIERYQRDSFWASSGLYEYIQIFIISNGTNTKYYSNTTRISAIEERKRGRVAQKTSNSFEFTSFWSDANNKVIYDLVDFTNTFLQKHTLLNVLTKYCVLTADDLLLVMRPYQIVATERILNRILIADNHKLAGTINAGGYIWHATGSGKTLTSFKTAQLASKIEGVDKVLFVVDRKDLDYQTMREYDRFEKGSANGNRSTAILQRQLEDKDAEGVHQEYKIIVTTIQKLDHFITKNPNHDIYDKHVVMIFDECHRSQFGDMHSKIVKKFKNYNIFGFTGTPIFAVNSNGKKYASINGDHALRTTEQAFGDKLHTYTVVDAISDGNVLPFKIDYINTIKQKIDGEEDQVEAINTESALLADERIEEIVRYTLKNFNKKTKRSGTHQYGFNSTTNVADVILGKEKQTVKINAQGFNSIFAVSSIEAAKKYYLEFKRQIKNSGIKLNIATIYSFGANEADPDGFIDDENSDSAEGLDMTSREFLESAIRDYNATFHTAYDTSSAKFPNYYKDVSLRMKNREIDMLIVVNMFLTGFDATTLNTLWVDKNLEYHGLIQAFSRTNRILNSVKRFGHIVCFRDLQNATDNAIALFGDKDASGLILMRPYNDYYHGYDDEEKHHDGYIDCVDKLITKFPIGEKILGEKAIKEFLQLFGKILRLRNILQTFDEFAGNEILSEIEYQDYTGMYNDLYDEIRNDVEAEDILNDIVFEIELVKHTEVNIDYILEMVQRYHAAKCQDKEILVDIDRAIRSNPELKSKKALIEDFIDSINIHANKDWVTFVQEQRDAEIARLIQEENLKVEETKAFLEKSFRSGALKTVGGDIDKLMPPISIFGGKRAATRARIVEKLKIIFDKYLDAI